MTRQPRRKLPVVQKEEAPTSLEVEAANFIAEKVKEDKPVDRDNDLLSRYSAAALSGLLSTGRYVRPQEVVSEAFEYGRLMLRRHKDEN